jgi:hypothetical protein
VSILFALLLPLLLGFGALAVDYPYLWVTRAQMQTTADAAAMAGGRYLGEGGTPNWTTATAQAQAMLASNLVDGKVITQASIQTGYWDTSGNQLGLQLLPMTPAKTDVPAIRVAISRSSGQNTGEIKTFFANFFGIASLPVSVTAVAARAGPSTIGANVLFPLAMPQCMYDTYWNASSTPPGPKIDPSTKKAYVFQFGSATYAGCNINGNKFPAGAWAAATSADTSSSALQSLVTSRIGQSMSIGDRVFVNSGNFGNPLYTAVNNCSASAAVSSQTCRYVSVAIFANNSTTGYNPITGFSCIEILSAVGGSSKYVQASMSTQCPTTPSSGIGPSYGVSGPPKLFF